MRDLQSVKGLFFVHPQTGVEYGEIRPCDDNAADKPTELTSKTALAYDGCGNYFVCDSDGSVAFWDHETGQFESLARTVREFLAQCREPTPVALSNDQVKSVWIDPEFAKEHGISVDEHGRKKKQ